MTKAEKPLPEETSPSDLEHLSPYHYSKTVDNALRLLTLIGQAGPVPTMELAKRSSLHRSVIRRLLNSLQRHGFVWNTPDGYIVGPAVIRLADQVAPALQSVAQPVMRSLADTIGETVLCTVRHGTDAVLLCQERGLSHLLRVEDQPGARRPLYAGSSGAVLLSVLDDEEIEQCLSGATLTARDRAWAHITATRSSGYCRSQGELQPGVAAVATPVLAGPGEPLCAITVIVPEIRAAGLDDHVPLLLETTGHLQTILSLK